MVEWVSYSKDGHDAGFVATRVDGTPVSVLECLKLVSETNSRDEFPGIRL
jgi:hypothetical protein